MTKEDAKNERLWYDWAMKPSRVVLYARVSTRDKRQDTLNQLAQLREYCTKQSWTIIYEYVDHASGKSDDRPKFKEMMTAASKHDFDLVLFWSLDRFSREGVLETLQHLQRLTSYGVGWKSYTEQYLDSCGVFRDAVLSILATIAKQERIRLSERTVAGLERARKAGRIGGRPRVVTNRSKVAELHAAGKSLGDIAGEMNLSKTTVARIVRETAA
jgi:DNA invertase Pin-like site-specific DNA recombinase